MEKQENNLSIPVAIIIAGFIVAGGIYMSKSSTTPIVKNNVAATPSISIKPISKEDHILGNPDAPIALVEFSDTECPYCKMFHTTMNTVIDTYGKDGKVAWVYRHFPLDSIHPKARKEAEAMECANEIGGSTLFWKYTDELYRITTSNNTLDPEKLPIIAKTVGLDVEKFNNCLSSGKYALTVQAQFEDGIASGAQGTPYNVMILKKKLSTDTENTLNEYIVSKGLGGNLSISENKKEIVLNGALPLDIIKAVIDIVLK